MRLATRPDVAIPNGIVDEKRRNHTRKPIRAAVTFVDQASKSRIPGEANDLSLSGLFIATHRPAPFGSNVAIRITLPGQDRELLLPGVVRWVRVGKGMGVQFGLLGARDTHAIATALAVDFPDEAPTLRRTA